MSAGLTEEKLIKVPGLLSRWVRLGNGAKAHYATAGETGPSIILLHGGIAGSSGTAGWRYMAPFLGANGFRVYCPDVPGFGWSDTREEYHPVNGPLDHVDFVEQFAQALCLDSFFLGGNSLGMLNSLYYAVRYPHRVKGLALIAGPVGDHLKIDLNKDGPVDISQLKNQSTLQTIVKNPASIPAELVEMREAAAERQAESYLHVMRTNMHRGGTLPPDVARAISLKDRITQLSIPGIVLWGLDDVIMPVALGYQQEDVVPNFQYFYPEDCGHQGQTDRPDLFNKVFLEFFRDGRISRTTANEAGVSKRRPELANLVEQG